MRLMMLIEILSNMEIYFVFFSTWLSDRIFWLVSVYILISKSHSYSLLRYERGDRGIAITICFKRGHAIMWNVNIDCDMRTVVKLFHKLRYLSGNEIGNKAYDWTSIRCIFVDMPSADIDKNIKRIHGYTREHRNTVKLFTFDDCRWTSICWGFR